MKIIYQITKVMALVVAGAFLGILAVPFESWISDNLILITIVLVVLTLYGIGLADWVISLWFWFWMKSNRKRSTIGIYAPYENQIGSNSTWVGVEVQTISNLIENKKIRHKVAKSETVFKTYPIIVNPFGGVYPEKDLSTLQALETIFEYVRGGGVYINIADIPFYYAFDKILNRRVDTTPLAGDFSLTRSFFQTILTKKLHCFVLGIPNGMPANPEVKRVIEVSSSEQNLFEDMIKNEDRAFSPVIKIPYGQGFFIFSTLRINQENLENNIMRVIDEGIKLIT